MTDAGEETKPAVGQRDPDARGYFGAFGGRFVPETLVEPIAELEREYFRVRADPAFRQELDALLRHYVGRPTPLYEASRLARAKGPARIFLKREDLTHTGAHKINNALGTGAARCAHGEEAGGGRDGRGAARRRHGDRLRAPGARLRGLHGRGGHGAPGPQRPAHGAARGNRAPRRRGQPHAQGRHQRGHARLGHQRRRHVLPPRLGARAAPVPADGARVPVGDRPRGEGTDSGAGGAAAHGGGGLRGRRQQCHRHLRRVRERRGRAAHWRGGRRPRHHARPARGAFRRRQRRHPAGHAHLRSAGRRGKHRDHALHLSGTRLRRGRPRTRVAARSRAAPSTRGSTTAPRSMASRTLPGWRASCPRSSRRTPSRTRSGSRPTSGRTTSSW